MKQYKSNYDVKNILQVLKKHTTIRKKLHCSEKITETFYSEQGIYQVTNKDIFKLNVITEGSQRIIPCAKNSDMPCAKNSDISWILDKTCFSREKVYQMPVEHVKITLMQYIFSQSPESKVRFVVEMILINDGDILLKDDHGDMFLREKNIVDFYFDIYDNADIPWQEINEFLLVWK
jgi:hypothetical protein